MTHADGICILLVEDEELNRALVRAILTRTKESALTGVRLVEAGSLGSARTVLATDQPNIVLLDMNLPDGSGLSLLGELARRAPRPRVIALTAAVLPENRAAALASGCDAFLDKPYTASALTSVLLEHLAIAAGDS
jgi:two-component system KDP operon response regulator KdpE